MIEPILLALEVPVVQSSLYNPAALLDARWSSDKLEATEVKSVELAATETSVDIGRPPIEPRRRENQPAALPREKPAREQRTGDRPDGKETPKRKPKKKRTSEHEGGSRKPKRRTAQEETAEPTEINTGMSFGIKCLFLGKIR